jgi:hypothetical protein
MISLNPIAERKAIKANAKEILEALKLEREEKERKGNTRIKPCKLERACAKQVLQDQETTRTTKRNPVTISDDEDD